MRVLIWHGWLLSGSGSNIYTARVAERLRAVGHDVVVLCQEPHPERSGFVDLAGPVTATGPQTRIDHGPGRCVVLRPEIGTLLPVFVVDEYEGFEVKRFLDLTDGELERYVDSNVAALRAATAWHQPDVVIAGHAVPGAVVARRALGPGRYVAKVHGSDIEYAIREQPRYAAMAREGLEAAVVVVGGSKDVLARAIEFAPGAVARLQVIPPGVEVERFRPRPRREALLEAASLLERDPQTRRGRRGDLGWVSENAVFEYPSWFERMARLYDQDAPDRDAARRLRGLATNRGSLIGYFGKIIGPKGAHEFVQALALTQRRRGLVVGFGGFREELWGLVLALGQGDPEWVRRWEAHTGIRTELTEREIFASRGLPGRVTFTGRLDHRYAPFALAAMDVLVVPSILDEAFAMVSAEGAACGALPLVARHSGLSEVAEALENEVGRPGLFSYAPGAGSAHRIAEGVQRLLAIPPAGRDELRRAVSAFVAREWTWDRTAARLLEAATRRPAAGSPADAPPAGST